MLRATLIGLCLLQFAAAAKKRPAAAKNATKLKVGCKAPYRLTKKHRVLQRNLQKALRGAGLSRSLDRKRLGVSVVDLSSKKRVYYAGINDDAMMYAASLPKIAILLTVVEAVEQGRLKWTHDFDRRLSAMIRSSNNVDASWATDLVGLLAIEKVMRDPRYCFYDEKIGGLWVGRAFRKGGATHRDPLLNISHGASARQAARFYTMLYFSRLVTAHWSFRMLGLMAPPDHHHKFVAGLTRRGGVIFLARKSGSWRNFHADSALIKHKDKVYVLAAVSELSKGEVAMRSLAGIVDDLIMAGDHRKRGRQPPSAKR